MKGQSSDGGASTCGTDLSAKRMWYALEMKIGPEAREAVLYGLMEAGALGTEEGEQTATAYFDEKPDEQLVGKSVENALMLYGLSPLSIGDMRAYEVPNEDWLAEWKKDWRPITVGRRFVVAPPWSDVAAEPDRIIIRIEPGMAFGTGTHETTRLCLAAIESHFAGGSFLDVGTGTGILAIAAAKLFPDARIDACDNDPDAIVIARENARLNGVESVIDFRVGSVGSAADADTRSADLVCANLTADVIIPLLPELVGATCGRLILSGILVEQIDQVEARLGELGIDEFEIRSDGDWVAFIA